MNIETSQFVTFIFSQLLVAAAIYGGLRADIRHLIREVDAAKKAAEAAHARIDAVLRDNNNLYNTGSYPAFRNGGRDLP